MEIGKIESYIKGLGLNDFGGNGNISIVDVKNGKPPGSNAGLFSFGGRTVNTPPRTALLVAPLQAASCPGCLAPELK